MTAADLFNQLLFWPLLASGLLLPGWLLGRIVRSSVPWLSSFLGSAVVLLHLVLGLDAFHIPLTPAMLAVALGTVNGLLLILVLRTRTLAEPRPAPAGPERPRGWERLWMVPPALALAAIALRAVIEPLSGYDNVFRWDFLARQMLRTGTLAFYPPVTADDFRHYGWCDGIPPLVPVLDLWSYASAGKAAALATAPCVVLQAGLLFSAVARLASGLRGAAAGWPAAAALATSSLLLWGVAMGQETGITALSLVAMFVFLDEHRRHGGTGSLFWAGVAAGAGALAREYGLAWMILGVATLGWHGSMRGWRIFLPTAVAIAMPWYLRNWVRTGDPLFAHDLAGIFPGNAVHLESMRLIGEIYGIGSHAEMFSFGIAVLAVLAGAVAMLGMAGWLQAPRLRLPLFASIIAVGLLWLWSVGQTAGGWVYSARVLTPALALAAVLAGGFLAGLKMAGRRIAAVAVVPFATDAALRSLYLPMAPLEAPWHLSPVRWTEAGRILDRAQEKPVWKVVAKVAGPRGIVVVSPQLFATLSDLGAVAVPLPSPQIAFVFNEDASFAGTLDRLKAGGIRFVAFSEHDPVATRLVENHSFLRQLHARPPVLRTPQFLLYDLDFIAP